MDSLLFATYQTTVERIRIVDAAQALLLERGVGVVELVDVAVALRIPLAAVEKQFPAGKSALVHASLEAHMHDIHSRLLTQRQECSNAVEDLLAMRRLLLQQIGDTRSLFMQELAQHYPAINRTLHYLRTTFTRDYLQDNLRRGIQEGYYRADLSVEEQAHDWLRQADTLLGEARSAAELSDAQRVHFDDFLAAIATPLGLFVARRLQEMPPYY
jgi:AcrR family transcriptional regulator